MIYFEFLCFFISLSEALYLLYIMGSMSYFGQAVQDLQNNYLKINFEDS